MTAVSSFGQATAETVPWTVFRRRLLSFVGRRVAEASDAEDIVQAVLGRAAAELEAGRQHGDLVGWLFQMTRNALTDHYRRRVRRERQLERLAAQVDDEGDMADPVGDESDGLSTFADCVGPMVAALAEPYGSAIRRVDLEGTSQAAFARELGLSPSGAKSRVQRGRAMLREAFLRCCIAERTATNASGRFERGACRPGTDFRRCGGGAPAGECPPRPPSGQGE